MQHYGFRRIQHVLNCEGALRGVDKLTVQCSSLGLLSDNYISSLKQALCGSANAKMELIWPSAEFVRTSIVGWNAGGSIPFNEKGYNSAIQSIMTYKYGGTADRVAVPPHIKTMFRRENEQSNLVSWFYLGSHNLSKSSWGESQLNDTQFRVPSFEIGVLFLPRLLSQTAGCPVELRLGSAGDVAAGTPGNMPLPYVYPPQGRYDHVRNKTGDQHRNLDNMPWMWDHDFGSISDVHGVQWHGIRK